MRRILITAIVLTLTGSLVRITQAEQKVPAAAPASSSSSSSAGLTAEDTLAFLLQTIEWYRHLAVEQQLATDPAETLFINQDRTTAQQVLGLAFSFARTEAQLLDANKTAPAGSEPQSSSQTAETSKFQTMTRLAGEAEDQIRQSQAEIDSLKSKLGKAAGHTRSELQAQLDEAQSALDLTQTRAQTFQSILQTISEAGATGATGTLLAQIEELQKSFPEIETDTTKPPSSAAAAAMANASSAGPAVQNNAASTSPVGILNLITDLVALAHKRQGLTDTINLTDKLTQAGQKVRTPLVKELTGEAGQGEEIAKEESADPTTLEQHRHELDVLTASLKQTSTVVVPLAKQNILLGLYNSNLDRWREAVQSRSDGEAWSLLIRLGLLGLALAAIFILGHIWNKATLHYVHDMHRRHQFLVLRRIVIWCAVAITVAFSLATELGALATFAGLITAGIAVALQNVILAIAGYFFLIGRYGVRIGDRVQVSGVTGNVVEIGLIRLYLMELTGTGNDRQPTGRIVVFSNSIVFQASAGFYKQIPGTNFVWQEITLILAPESEYRLAETRILEAVEKVYAGYREKIEQEYRSMQQTYHFAMEVPKPQSRLRLTETGLEVVVRYPLDLEHSGEIDDQVTRELMDALARSPKLTLVGSGKPNILPVTDSSPVA